MTEPMPATPAPPHWVCRPCRLRGAVKIGDVTPAEVAYLAETHDRSHHEGQPTAVVVDSESGLPITMPGEAPALFSLAEVGA